MHQSITGRGLQVQSDPPLTVASDGGRDDGGVLWWGACVCIEVSSEAGEALVGFERLCTDHTSTVSSLHGGGWTGWMGWDSAEIRIILAFSCVHFIILVSWFSWLYHCMRGDWGVHMYWIYGGSYVRGFIGVYRGDSGGGGYGDTGGMEGFIGGYYILIYILNLSLTRIYTVHG